MMVLGTSASPRQVCLTEWSRSWVSGGKCCALGMTLLLQTNICRSFWRKQGHLGWTTGLGSFSSGRFKVREAWRSESSGVVWGAVNEMVWLEQGCAWAGTSRGQDGIQVRPGGLDSPAEGCGLYPIGKKCLHDKMIFLSTNIC